ncbi:UDP-glucuronic acid decarboxylase family protein [Sphingomonas sp. URHD0057]|uniref:UDP-glucuronic acid decarboxylase family protein n=1 Tax=Sphingomonas sp. URHD0057 TaxID=1380389 RepID=UPI00048D6B2E|nr:UDP-glucuronic acid decarboxylase family protein [Sphingomonas sp. URHD0057]
MKRGAQVALVAGGAGFIGSHICDRLIDAGAYVVCLDNFLTGRLENIAHLEGNHRFSLIEHDVVDPLPRWAMRFTHVFNFACAASPPHYQADPEHTLLTNVVGTRNLLQVAEQCGARFLLASTSEVYGDAEQHPQREDYRGAINCTGPRACYDEGKRAAEALTFDFVRAGRCEARVARIFNTYGPRISPDDGRVISNVICQALEGRDITIYGDGSQTRSFCFVDDTVEGLLRLMDSTGPAAPVNLGNPEEVSVQALAERILALTGSNSRIVGRPLPEDDPRRRRPDIGRARQLLDWQPTVTLDTGLTATIAWLESQVASGVLLAAE